jgi:hypothetical protein
VQAQVEHRELELAQVCRPLWKFFAAIILSNSARGSGSPVSAWAVMPLQHVPFPAEVLHELAGQFDRIPFDAVDAGHRQFVDLGEQVVQAVAALVEQGDHVVVGEGGRFAPTGAGKVAVEVGHRRLHAVAEAAAGDGVVHPGAAALGVAGVQVEVELADQLARALDAEEAHVRVPHRRGVGLDVTPYSFSITRNRPSSTLGSGKYCFTSSSEKA